MIINSILARNANRWQQWNGDNALALQLLTLRRLLKKAAGTEQGVACKYKSIAALPDDAVYQAYTDAVPVQDYEQIREQVMRMLRGEKDILWPGRCYSFAQSSGTSGGKSKYIPVTKDSLRINHYAGAQDAVAFYMAANPKSRMFYGKGLILGGSFANELHLDNPKVRVGDLSAHLIDNINPLVNLVRIPDKKTALIEDWAEKLPRLVEVSKNANITNISGVPSWFLTLIKEVMAARGVEKISDAWPNLEVFFHGGISFEPYREIYKSITDPQKMHFVETYNASEGFFAAQNDLSDLSMLLLLDRGVFYEFIPMTDPEAPACTIADVKVGKVYKLIISTPAGLWRYDIGDTVLITGKDPLKIKIAGRTQSYINAFGEEVMEHNANHAIARACQETGASVRNYTVAPLYATTGSRGCHQWLIEWETQPTDINRFAEILDRALQEVNSDYQAKRAHGIFLDAPKIESMPTGSFDNWLKSVGNGKLGGQRKIPRLSNDRRIADALLRGL